MKNQYDSEIRAKAINLCKTENLATVSRLLNIPRTTLNTWVEKHAAGTIDDEGVKERDKLAAKEKIAELEREIAKLAPQRLPVETYTEEPAPVKDLWTEAEKYNAKYIERADKRSKFTLTLSEELPIAVTFVSDQHICTRNTVDLQRMRQDAELIRDTPGVVACLAGDGVDNHIKHAAAVLAARSQPDEQWKLYEHYLEVFAEKIVVMLTGNHDHWTNQIAGIDMVKRLAEKQVLRYAPHEARVALELPGQSYLAVIRHSYRYSSTLNQCHTVKRLYDMGSEPFDVGVVGHHHEAAIEMFLRHGEQRWALRPGSYQITSDYMDQRGYNMARPTCPTVILYPHKRKILGFPDLRHVVDFLRSERGGQ
jgi:transposase-like protein